MNKIILITGATSGIGLAAAHIFAKHNWSLILTGRRAERLHELKKQFQANNNIDVLILPFDIQKSDQVMAQLQNLPKQWQAIDILLNNAGLALGKESFDQTIASDWETMIDTNLKGMLYTTYEIVKYMKSQGHGHIINISSTAGKETYAGGNVYSATKFAVEAFTKSLRIDLLEHNIKVSSIAPGMVATEFSKVRFKGDEPKADAVYKGFDPLQSEDIAEIIFFVATRPAHVNIGDLMVTCTAQANSTTVYKQ